jgi:pimeloyl-ACP methyl ester carboxylesterase
MEIGSHPYNNSLVILIHGVMSNQYVAWKPVIDLLQQIHLAGSSPLRSYDYYAFNYESGLVHQPSIDQCFNSLRTLIGRARYDTVVLVGHSQGGVVAKLFLIDELLNGRGITLKVDMVITLDSPHLGPQPWIYPAVVVGGIWKRIPLVNRFPLFRQTGEMGRWSANLRKLRANWNEKLIAEDPCPPQPMRRHIRSFTASGTRPPFFPFKLVVSKRSARGFKIDHPIPVSKHQTVAWGLGHEVTAMHAYRDQIEQKLSEHCSDEILGLTNNFDTVQNVALARILNGFYPPSAPPCEVECWTRRLKFFRARPLRKLALEAALNKFIALRIANP